MEARLSRLIAARDWQCLKVLTSGFRRYGYRLLDRQNGALCFADCFFSDASHQQPGDSSAAMRTHDNQIHILGVRRSEDWGGRITCQHPMNHGNVWISGNHFFQPLSSRPLPRQTAHFCTIARAISIDAPAQHGDSSLGILTIPRRFAGSYGQAMHRMMWHHSCNSTS